MASKISFDEVEERLFVFAFCWYILWGFFVHGKCLASEGVRY